MKYIHILFCSLIIFSLLSGCVSREALEPIDRSRGRWINYKGVIIVELPQGQEWHVLKKGGDDPFYGKKLESNDHTFIASVQLRNITIKFKSPEEFLTFVKDSRVQDTSKNKFTIINYEESLDQSRSDYCTKYVMKAEEAGKGILESKGYTCLHPHYPKLGVTIQYSERTKGPAVSDQVRSEGERFINSLEFRQ